MQSNYFIAPDPLSLDRIRNVLTRLEDTILFQLIERAQFAHNPIMYQPKAFPELVALGFEGSWLEWFLKEIESFHAKARRYTSPDEYPFTTGLPAPVTPSLNFPKILYPNDINANPSILKFYIEFLVPALTRQASDAIVGMKRSRGLDGDDSRDDGNHGSAATLDVELLQTISKRVHYGKFVSESKFVENPAAFIGPIRNRDTAALEALITKPEVERRLLLRLQKKAAQYAVDFEPDGRAVRAAETDNVADTSMGKADIETVVGDLYEKYIIPLTKEVEVDYLLRRLDGLSEDQVESLKKESWINLDVKSIESLIHLGKKGW